MTIKGRERWKERERVQCVREEGAGVTLKTWVNRPGMAASQLTGAAKGRVHNIQNSPAHSESKSLCCTFLSVFRVINLAVNHLPLLQICSTQLMTAY